jgi:hypothetical protein
MKPLRVFLAISILLGGGMVAAVGHGVWSRVTHPSSVSMYALTGLGGNPLENNTLYFRHFECSDYMSGHFYYPSAPLLGHESFIYRVKHCEP